MQFSRAESDIFVPDGSDPLDALRRVTHLCIAAHQDDVEIMAYAGIVDALEQPGKAFGAVVVTDGGNSPRAARYAAMTDAEMKIVRRDEQRNAARLGRYAIQIQLGYPSSEVKVPGHPSVVGDLSAILSQCSPEVLYLHNPADKHDTHVAVLQRCLEARRAAPHRRFPRVLGCEVWRDLDWLPDSEKVALDSGRLPELADRLLRVFDSQIAGGKRYDLATLGRRRANATFHTSHGTDKYEGITWAMDLTPLFDDQNLSITKFAADCVERLREDVISRNRRMGGG
jgi:LmbE family N-acetylglucosaminyl deacetylase